MAGDRVKFGLTLPNRGVVIGATTVAEMLQLAADAESSSWDSVWVGDSIFAKPRLDAMVLMGAIAARTTRVRIGPAASGRSRDRDVTARNQDFCVARVSMFFLI
jgi:alkanesulfonate monooxygenase SsuD/methylene tetrahydromethanopterin reductase-like flavin-dependent oxidoreductase (luciferase family)